jgi:hypothetical protein
LRLSAALNGFLKDSAVVPHRNFADILACLLKHGANPNESPICASEQIFWEMLLDKAGTLAKDKKGFYANFEVDGYSKLFADAVRQFIVSGADVDVSASTILQDLFTSPTWVRSKFGRGTIGDPGLFKEVCRCWKIDRVPVSA